MNARIAFSRRELTLIRVALLQRLNRLAPCNDPDLRASYDAILERTFDLVREGHDDSSS